jgi:glutamate dehydrogenase
MQALLSVFDIVVEAAATGRPQEVVMDAYFDIGARLGLDWLRDRILELPRDDRWQALARAALRDDLYRLHRSLVRDIFAVPGDDHEPPVEAWLSRNAAGVERSLAILGDVRASREYDTTTLPVALREFKNLLADGEQLT